MSNLPYELCKKQARVWVEEDYWFDVTCTLPKGHNGSHLDYNFLVKQFHYTDDGLVNDGKADYVLFMWGVSADIIKPTVSVGKEQP